MCEESRLDSTWPMYVYVCVCVCNLDTLVYLKLEYLLSTHKTKYESCGNLIS